MRAKVIIHGLAAYSRAESTCYLPVDLPRDSVQRQNGEDIEKNTLSDVRPKVGSQIPAATMQQAA